MSAILLGQKPLENPFLLEEEINNRNSPNDDREKAIEGKNKTYIISKTLGKGTFGKVKLAYNKDNKNEKYACKILLKSNIKDEDDYMRCKREMDILKKMHHVNVVRTYEIISTETTYYIFMDFCSKGELFNYIVEKQHLSQELSAFFYYQLINGIEYIHKKGVCHRDLKPENLLLTEKNKLKIIDFGLSNYFKGNLLETPCGSPCYASPEMVMGNKYNGFCIDIWSSGIILYAMLCGYLPFEEMENDEYNEVLFRNIVECNVDYPNEFITPVAKDLLCKILVKDPKKRITIEEIKLHNFYLLGELLYRQTFENKGNINEYMFFMDENEKFIEIEDLKDINDTNNIILEQNIINLDEKISKKEENSIKEGKIMEEEKKSDKMIKEVKEDIDKDENIKKEKEEKKNDLYEIINMTPVKPEKKEENKNIISGNKNKTENNNETSNRVNIIDKIKQIIQEQNNKNHNQEKEELNKKNIKNNISKNSHKKSKSKDLSNPKEENKKHSNKQLSLETYHNIQIPTSINEKNYKDNILQNSLNIKKYKTNKEEKSQKEYSVQEEYSNHNKNSNEINFKNQYLKTEICPTNSKHKTKTKKSHYQCKLLNKKFVNSNKIPFDNLLKSLQNKNNIKNKTPKRFSTKKNMPVKQNSNQSNSITRKKYSSYSPGIRKVSKNGNNIINNIEKNINFPRKNNNYPLTTHNNIKNSYYFLQDNILKYLDSKFFYNNINTENKKKYFKANKKFVKKSDGNAYNNVNSINNENYYRGNNNIIIKNNEEKKILKNSVNNVLNIKSFEYCLSSNTSKKKHIKVDKKTNNDMNIIKSNILTNNFNLNKNTKNNISKKSFGNLKGNNYINNIFSDNSKPILINSSHIRKKTETIRNKINKNINSKNNKIKTNSNKNSKSKSKYNKKNNLLSHKMNNLYNKDNIDNNIIINFNILKPNIILDHQRASSRKTKTNKFGLNTNITHSNNFISSKVERPITESNFCSTVRNNFFNRSSKNKYYNSNYKNIDLKQIKKSKEINQIIKSIQEVKKVQGNITNINNNKKRMNTEF